jgi:hypothetical protein
VARDGVVAEQFVAAAGREVDDDVAVVAAAVAVAVVVVAAAAAVSVVAAEVQGLSESLYNAKTTSVIQSVGGATCEWVFTSRMASPARGRRAAALRQVISARSRGSRRV